MILLIRVIFYQIYNMDLSQTGIKSKKNSPLILTVLNMPPRSQLREINSPSPEYALYVYTPKKIVLAAYRTMVQKSKLLTNLQTYEWRCQTQFPIVKTAFVAVRQNDCGTTQTVEITAYNEHCPLKLTQIYEMPVGQMLYLLKQTMLGFERLYNRFGSFEILNSMIALNEKGFCRVWFNQNFALNSFPKREITESKMVHKIITILQSHSQQSKQTKKLFSCLRQCATFLSALKTIQIFVKQSKLFVPTKFISISSTKQIPRFEMPVMARQNQSETDSPVMVSRFSIKDQKFNKFREIIKQELKNSQRDRKNSSSPIQIKRLKSQKTIKDFESLIGKGMKVSDQQTAHTGKRNRTPNADPYYASPRQTSIKQIGEYKTSKKKRPGWIEQSSYVMGQDLNISQQNEKKKIQMTRSYASNVFQTNMSQDSRKYSCKISPDKIQHKSPTKNTYFGKKSNEPYFIEFESLLNNDQKQKISPRKKISQQVQEQKLRSELSGSVLKNNGWVAKVSGLLDMPANLQQSFHEGHEEVLQKDIKLDKLNNVGRQQMLMSILHQQIEDLL